ncbi:MAG TPA: SIS domain-containing protein [bacterium]|nr:SIS domain-containing protein [bacterium]
MKGQRTIAEIREQPEVLARVLDAEWRSVERLARRLRRRHPPAIILTARGSSDNAALYGHYLFETLLGIPAGLASPSVVTLYGAKPRVRGALVIGLSQSGRSPDIVEYVAASRTAGAFTIAITNDGSSPLARRAHATLLLHAGPERSVAATKTYTAQLALLSLLVGAIAGERRFIERHHALPELVRKALDQESTVTEVAHRYQKMERCIVTSRGYNFGTAREAALKLKETAYIAAEALSSADLLHGPIAVVERRFPVIVIAPPGRARAHLATVTRRLRSRGADAIVLSNAGSVLHAPGGIDERLTPHVYIVPLQLLAYHLALLRGFDPDHPRGLHKVTRVL